MTTEVFLTLGGLILSVLTYFAGVWQTERRFRKDDRESRIRAVFDRYMEFRRTNYMGGIDGLLKSGVATLASEDEIRELVERIAAHGEKHPLGGDRDTAFADVDLCAFFSYAARERVSFLQQPLDEIIAASGAKRRKA